MTKAMLKYLIKAVGPSTPLIDLETFLSELEQFTVSSLVAGFNNFSWQGWSGKFESSEDNKLAQSIAPTLALLGFAHGQIDSSIGQQANNGDIIDLHTRYLAVDSARYEMHKEDSLSIAKAVIGTDLAFLLPDLHAAEQAVNSFSLCRMQRAQMVPSHSSFDEITRTWWIARRLDIDADQLKTAQRVLGMEVPVFIRSAIAILALAVTSNQIGCFSLERPIDASFTSKYDVDADTLRLAAYKLSASRDEIINCLRDIAASLRPGMHPFAPMPLMSTPLLRFTDSENPPFVCPSIGHFISAIRDRVREAISQQGGMPTPAIRLYGDHLSKYVEAAVTATGTSSINLDLIEPQNSKHADFFLSDGDFGIILEIKRSIAKGMSRYLVNAQGIADVLNHLLSAYKQCQSTHGRMPWKGLGISPSHIVSLILIDEPLASEGAVFAELLSAQVAVRPPFDVLSITEFEHVLGVHGVRGIVQMVERKWAMGLQGLPLDVFASKELGIPTKKVLGARGHLRPEDQELFLELGLTHRDKRAEWP
jgi:hypothetical protein